MRKTKTNGPSKGKTSIKVKLNIRANTPSDHYTVVIQVIRQRRRSLIFTPYRLRTEEFDAERGVAVTRSRSREYRAHIEKINEYVRHRIGELRLVESTLEREGRPFSATEIAHRFRQRNENRYVETYFRSRIEELHCEGKHGSALSLEHTLRVFLKFAGHKLFLLDEVDLPLMIAFRNYLLREGLAPNTTTFYMSTFRSVYNHSIAEGYVIGDKRPFEGLSIRIRKTRKLALSDDVLRKVAQAELTGPQAVARDLFMLSFYCRGMSFVDMAYLQEANVREGVMHYRRRKTGQLFIVRVIPAAQAILDRYRVPGSPFLLPILRDDAPEQKEESRQELYARYVRGRSRYIHLLANLARRLELDVRLSFNAARHTWASRARRKGISVAVISEGLGHTTEKTTRIYLEEMETRRIDDANCIITAL